ncbi:hypothetical protein D0T53_09105 [Dysgonomonas sp. 216]|uniref:hypothetical protein n=1 Tax=Dysgonomonas sp. 216 TaxID=2302934 RepID=UPI0013D2D2DB|nr:hypothetical protein [Dysgonomonas sp. 216]NDW19069.1 hypothetical protein [Dysgonomonas sp. 216]
MNIIISIGCIAFTALLAGKLLTEHPRYSLPLIHSWFDRKPFNCRPCATFHIGWILSFICSLIYKLPATFAGGLVVSFAIFLILYTIEKNRIDE